MPNTFDLYPHGNSPSAGAGRAFSRFSKEAFRTIDVPISGCLVDGDGWSSNGAVRLLSGGDSALKLGTLNHSIPRIYLSQNVPSWFEFDVRKATEWQRGTLKFVFYVSLIEDTILGNLPISLMITMTRIKRVDNIYPQKESDRKSDIFIMNSAEGIPSTATVKADAIIKLPAVPKLNGLVDTPFIVDHQDDILHFQVMRLVDSVLGTSYSKALYFYGAKVIFSDTIAGEFVESSL